VSVHGAGCGFTNQLVMEKPGSTCTWESWLKITVRIHGCKKVT
jgi:hypothetical protein